MFEISFPHGLVSQTIVKSERGIERKKERGDRECVMIRE